MTGQYIRAWSCGCVPNQPGEHRDGCPEFRKVELHGDDEVVRYWVRRRPRRRMKKNGSKA